MLKNLSKRLAILGLCLFSAGCGQRAPAAVNSFLLRGNVAELEVTSGQVVYALVSSLQAEGSLESAYPQVHRLTMEPDPSQANVQHMRCTGADTQGTQAEDCILLNQAGDFVRVQPITWESEAFYMYRIYVSPRLIFVRIDPAKDFVAIDVYLMHEPDLWEAVDHAIRTMADEIGARPFRP